MGQTKIIIGTRGSNLSLIQTEMVKKMILAQAPDLDITIKIIKTRGDKNMNPIPLDSVGKGWFTKELDKALLQRTIDLAVHSLKDLPEILPKGLIISAIPEREDAREALVSRDNKTFDKLSNNAVIGTDSLRRKTQILQKRSDVIVKSVRGNVNRRLEKLDNGEYDALLLAVAGLKRLGLTERIAEYFDPQEFIPSPGQGALAVVTKESNTFLNNLLKKLDHEPTIAAIRSERAFSAAIGGGCKMPVGAYAVCDEKNITLYGMIGSLDGKFIKKENIVGDITKPVAVGNTLAEKLMKKTRWYDKEQLLMAQLPRFVVITRPEKEKKIFSNALSKLGVSHLPYPTIAITKNQLNNTYLMKMKELKSYDWILFTSRNGVRYFMETLDELGINKKILLSKSIGAVGPKTAKEVKKYHLTVQIIPTKFTTDYLAQELQHISGKKILIPRSHIGKPLLIKTLQEKGATVTNIPIYKTQHVVPKNEEFDTLLQHNQICCITFTSPSTVEGFMKSITQNKEKILSIPVLSIGPITTKKAIESGFQSVFTADIYTIDGMITKFKESIL